MELQDVLNERRSIRSYDADKKVTKEQLEIIINAAILAPSWKNLQTSRYYCILSDEMIKEFSDKCLPEFNQKNSEGAALVVTTFVKNCVGFDRLSGEPVNECANGWGYYDLGLQNENFVLKAKESGLDTLIMGIRDGEDNYDTIDVNKSPNFHVNDTTSDASRIRTSPHFINTNKFTTSNEKKCTIK